MIFGKKRITVVVDYRDHKGKEKQVKRDLFTRRKKNMLVFRVEGFQFRVRVEL